MKKHILFLAVLCSSLAFAGADDVTFQQRNAADNGNLTRTPAHPLQDGLLTYDFATLLPKWTILGTNLSITGGVLNASSSAQVNTDWNAMSGVQQLLNKPAFATVAFTGQWGDLQAVPSTFPPSAHTHAAADIVSGTLADARIPALAISKTTGLQAALDGKFATPAGTTAQYVRGDGSLATLPAAAARSFGYTTRALNTCFQVSATRDTLVTYSVDIATSLSLTTGQQGTVYLETFSDSGCTTGTQELTRFVNGQTGTLTIGLALTQNVTGTLTGVIPAGMYVRLRTQNNTGTPTFTARPGQETLL